MQSPTLSSAPGESLFGSPSSALADGLDWNTCSIAPAPRWPTGTMNTIIFLKVGVVHGCLEAWKTIFVIVDSVSFYEDLIICSLNNILNMADSVTTVVFLYVKYH